MSSAEPDGDPLPAPAAVFADHQDAAPPLSPVPQAAIIAGPLRPAILRLALPAVGTTLFQVLFNYGPLGVWWILAFTAMARAAAMAALWHWGGWRSARA